MTIKWTMQDIPDMSGKLALITGANSGLGFNTTKGLAASGAKVIMACRTVAKAESARDKILSETPGADLEIRQLDLSDLGSVKSFAESIINDGLAPDLLINNAGVMAVPYGKTKDGFEMQIGTNHLGHFALTGLLINQLADGARIVNVASMAHRWTPGINLDDLNWEKRKYKRWQAYGDSKLSNLLFTFELVRRIKKAGKDISAVAAHPGYADTHLQYVAAEQKQSKLEKIVMDIGALFAQPADMGSLPSLYAATMSDVDSGDYIGPGGFQQMRGYPKKVGCKSTARNEDTAGKLWNLSEQLTQVSYLN